MSLGTRERSVGMVLASALLLATVITTAAGAFPLRSPQVPLQTGLDGISLQTTLNNEGEALNTLTDQLDLQVWSGPASGSSTLSLRMEIAGYAGSNSIGIYNANDANPTLFLVFPGIATPGWYATCAFAPGGHLTVSLYDASNNLQGSTNYSGVDRDHFGFYLQGPAGTFYSQDARNAGGHPQALTFAGTGNYAGQWWECFEDLPYSSSDVDFQDSILLLGALQPTPVLNTTWGSLKVLYR